MRELFSDFLRKEGKKEKTIKEYIYALSSRIESFAKKYKHDFKSMFELSSSEAEGLMSNLEKDTSFIDYIKKSNNVHLSAFNKYRDFLAKRQMQSTTKRSKEAIEVAPEGEMYLCHYNEYQRNKEIRDVVAKRDNYTCCVCGMNFADFYGEDGLGFIEVHHLNPINEGSRETKLEDLVSVCSNCHSMLHKKTPPLTPEMLKAKILNFIFFIIFPISIYAQDIEVKKFEPLEKDQTAVTSPRKDINGTACGLVKVALKEPGAEFEGNVMGDVQFTGSEYLVYMPNGSKRLGIKHPDYLPTTIVFADYGTKRVASSTTYELKVKANKKKAKIDNSKKGMAVFNVKPSNAMLLIDGQIADGSGGAYTLSLPYGTHYYTVKLKDFSINNQMVKIDKNAKNINMDLTEFFAKVSVNCPTEDAELTINGEQKGVGRWEGMMIPGKYTIKASKDGCHSQTRQIELKDNDEVAVDFTKLKTITGSLRVDYEPAGADVLLNGKKVGVTPLVIKELPVGDYQLEIWKEYYVKEFAKVKIAEDQVWKESGELKLTQFGRMIVCAENGIEASFPEEERGSAFIESPAMALAEYFRFGSASGYRGAHYACEKDSFNVPLNPVKAIYWLKKIVVDGDETQSNSAKEYLGKTYPSIADDALLSFNWAIDAYKEWGDDEKYNQQIFMWNGLPYAALAWHYFYGIGCQKDIEEAKRLMRMVCTEKGEYWYPSFKQIIKDMGLDNELKYNPSLGEPTDE